MRKQTQITYIVHEFPTNNWKIIMCIHTDIRLLMVKGKIIDRIVIYLPCNVTSTTTSLFCFMENRTPYINCDNICQ